MRFATLKTGEAAGILESLLIDWRTWKKPRPSKSKKSVDVNVSGCVVVVAFVVSLP
jgi:hypothetical protein